MCVFMSVNVCWAAGRGRTAMYGRLLFNILEKEVVRDLESGSRAESLLYGSPSWSPTATPAASLATIRTVFGNGRCEGVQPRAGRNASRQQ